MYEKLRWYRGPWVWRDGEYNPPSGTVGSLDLRSLPDQQAKGKPDGLGVFVSDMELPSEYDLLGVGNPKEIRCGQKTKDAIPKRRGFSLQGDDLLTHVRSCLMDGSDPTGDSYARPLMPRSDMRFHFTIGPWSDLELTAPWNAHWDKVQDVLRADFSACFADAMAGRMNDNQQHLRVLDALCHKYRVDDWRAFVMPSLRGEIPGRVPHATSYSDDFNRSDESLNAGAWTEVVGNWDVVSNEASLRTNDSSNCVARYTSDLSSADNEAQADVVTLNPGVGSVSTQAGVYFRQSSSANSGYVFDLQNESASDFLRLFKMVSGTRTNLVDTAGITMSLPETLKGSANGSALTGYRGGSSVISTTDTSLTSGLRGGLHGRLVPSAAAGDSELDNWWCTDLAASGIVYTQLESTPRGTRGILIRSMR